MSDFLFYTGNRFEAYTTLHWIPLGIVVVFMILSIYIAKYYFSDRRQVIFGTLLGCIPMICVIARMIFTAMDGTFSIQEELPFHLCRALAFMFPFIIYYKSRTWFGITYFFATVGTLQAILTPDLQLSAPHHSYFTYWLLHGVLIFLPIYCIVVFRFRIVRKDFYRAILAANVYLVFTGLINMAIGSNYFFTSHKPDSASLLDYLGPWPWYILAVEGIAIVLFVLAWIPFWFRKSN